MGLICGKLLLSETAGKETAMGSTVRYILKQVDLVLLGLCLAASGFGLVLIASATNRWDTLSYVVVQGAAVCLGVIAYFICSTLDMEHIAQKWKWILAFNVGFILLLLTPLGVERNGNRAWLEASWLPVNIQPAEIVKLSFILLLAKQFAYYRDDRQMRGLEPVVATAGHTLLMVALIFVVSGDMGSALVYLVTFAGVAFAAGVKLRWFAAGGTAAAVGITLLVIFDLVPQHMLKRFQVLLDHSYDPSGVGFQQTRALMALGSGQMFGQGLFQGVQTQSPNSWALPERQTDFIFAVCGEELGMVGCVAVLLILALIVWRCLSSALLAKSDMESFVCVGISTMLIFQIIENVGMCLFVMPVIGLTLPFFSYGGSSVLTLYAAMGMVSGIRRRSLPEWLRH